VDFDDFYPQSTLLQFIYKNSIIDQKEYYKTCVLISSETSNNQQDCENMEFYVFNNYMIILNEIIENKNAGNGNNGDSDASNNFNKTMSQAKSMIKNSTSNISKFKK
jgi:hypothetical protein